MKLKFFSETRTTHFANVKQACKPEPWLTKKGATLSHVWLWSKIVSKVDFVSLQSSFLSLEILVLHYSRCLPFIPTSIVIQTTSSNSSFEELKKHRVKWDAFVANVGNFFQEVARSRKTLTARRQELCHFLSPARVLIRSFVYKFITFCLFLSPREFIYSLASREFARVLELGKEVPSCQF